MIRVGVYGEWFIAWLPVLFGIIQNLGRSLLKFFLCLQLLSAHCLEKGDEFFPMSIQGLPDADRITASPSSRYNPTLVKSVSMDFS